MILIGGGFDPLRSICRKCATFAASGRSRTTIEPVGTILAICRSARPYNPATAVDRSLTQAVTWSELSLRDSTRYAWRSWWGIFRRT